MIDSSRGLGDEDDPRTHPGAPAPGPEHRGAEQPADDVPGLGL